MTIKIIIDISSKGDDWPEEVREIIDGLEKDGYESTASGSGGNENTEYKWMAVRLEKKIE